jgi:YD repeat-containing protein
VHYDISWAGADHPSNPTEISGGFTPYGDDYTAGWQYTEQTYDWKGRPLVTSHPDSTTRTASYSGCGCAGGDVVTLQDEGTMISSTLTRRKQRITNDVLGRTIKAETFDWDGSTAYQTVVTDYNALDQPILQKQYAGNESGTHQDTTYAYDGYGRLYYSRIPSQTANTYYGYYDDDRLYRRTDGRGAYRQFTYNDRRLVTGITYGSTVFGMTLPSTVSFEYDGAGNRISMEDGQGSVSYAYDQFSRMTSETREFDATLASAPSGGYKLTYTYHLNGSLASLKDPFDDEIDYAIDGGGRLTGVTGSSYGGVTTYADSAEYRASDVLKHLEYSNGQTMDVTFNSRMAPTSYQVTDGTHNVLSKEYSYYNTGQVRYSQDLLNAKFDRLYEFDQQGRIATAKSGAEARGSTDYPENIPYRQTYSYDAFGHLTGRSSNHWIATYSISDTYANDRNENWTYDAAGNLLVATDQTNTLDAAEQVTKVEVTGDSRTMQDFDGVGHVVHQRAEIWSGSSYYLDSEKYLIRSSVLGGAVVTETKPDGGKARSFVHAGGTVIAWQTNYYPYYGELVNWIHQEPSGASSRSTNSTGAVVISALYGAGAEPAELDPVGADAGTINPYTDPEIPPDDGTGSSSQSTTAFGAPWHPRATYSIDGLRVEPEFYIHFGQWNHVSAFTGLMFAAERSVNRFLYYQVRGDNGEDTIISHDSPSAENDWRAVWGAIELHGIAQRVWIAGVWNLSVVMFAVSDGSQNPVGQPLASKPRLLAINAFFDLYARLKNGEISDNCRKKVFDKLKAKYGFDLDAFVAYLGNGAHLFDGTNSQTPIVGGITTALAARSAFPRMNTVADVFKEKPGLTALTSFMTSSFTVFLRPEDLQTSNSGANGQNLAQFLHEALHGYGASLPKQSYYDQVLQAAFGLKVDPKNTQNITDYIRNNCF